MVWMRAWVAAWVCVCAVGAAQAGSVHRYGGDTVEQKDLRRFPPDPQVNYKHLKLEIDMPKPESKSFRAVETMTFVTPGRAIGSVELDAMGLKIGRVTDLNGGELSHRHDGEKLLVRFGKELPPGTEAGFRVEYECREPKLGMIFALPDEAYKDRPPVIHTQGQADMNRYWFVCHDSPNARFTSETIVRVPEKYTVVGNGKLVSKKSAGDDLVAWHHVMDRPHVAYLVSLVIGELDVVTDEWRGKPVEYFVPKGTKAPVRKVFGKTPKMLEVFSELLGVEYPYAKYAQTVVPLFEWGGMENISATTLFDLALLDDRALLDQDMEWLIAHELGHQWFGDMVTCRSWPHIWLNEGWATYLELVWAEQDAGKNEYTHKAWKLLSSVAATDSVEAAGGLVHAFYEKADEVFWRQEDYPYNKGASVLHMLRRELGDDLFWACVREYLKRYAWKVVETDDFRRVIEELSGRSFEKFFHQWVYKPGAPNLKVTYRWDDAAKEAHVEVEQKQKITKEIPAFDLNVQVWFVAENGEVSKHVARVAGARGEVVVKREKEPAQVCVDPMVSLLAKWDVTLPGPMIVRSVKEGPTLGAKLHAASLLKQMDSAAGVEVMKSVLLDEKADRGLREAVADSLGTMQSEKGRRALVETLREPARILDHKVRVEAVRALAKYRHAEVAPVLERIAMVGDATYTAEAEAWMGLARQPRNEQIAVLLRENAAKREGSDEYRRTILKALGELDDWRGVVAAFRLAGYGQRPPVREEAIRILGKLGRHEEVRDQVREALVSFIGDAQPHVGEAVFAALGELGDEKAVPALQAFADGSAPREDRDAARKAIDEIRKKSGESAVVKDLKDRIEKLEKKIEEMKGK